MVEGAKTLRQQTRAALLEELGLDGDPTAAKVQICRLDCRSERPPLMPLSPRALPMGGRMPLTAGDYDVGVQAGWEIAINAAPVEAARDAQGVLRRPAGLHPARRSGLMLKAVAPIASRRRGKSVVLASGAPGLVRGGDDQERFKSGQEAGQAETLFQLGFKDTRAPGAMQQPPLRRSRLSVCGTPMTA